MPRIWSFESALNTTISSTRLRNSGRNRRLSSPIARLLISLSESWPDPAPKPIVPGLAISRAPTLDVMMMTVLEKSTLRPWPSVSLPSSRIWSSRLKTSGWAFSISSKSTTEYGRRRTALVSSPPSS